VVWVVKDIEIAKSAEKNLPPILFESEFNFFGKTLREHIGGINIFKIDDLNDASGQEVAPDYLADRNVFRRVM